MRLGLIGPCAGDPAQVATFAEFLVSDLLADRVLYLGLDAALDDYVARTAEQIVGGDPHESAIWRRATELCRNGSPEAINAFVEAQREREQLRIYESLETATGHAVELLGGKVALLTHDKANLDADDMMPASFLVFGKSAEPLTRKVGTRWFVSPGVLPSGGALLMDDSQEPVLVTLYDGSLEETGRVSLVVDGGAQVKVSE